MGDKLKLSALCVDQQGKEEIRSMTLIERDSEMFSEDDKTTLFLFACTNANIRCIGEITEVYL